MKRNLKGLAFVLGLVIAVPLGGVRAQRGENPTPTQQETLIRDEDIGVIEFAEMEYPVPRGSEFAGIVVVRVKLDDEGGVLDAIALSGNPRGIPQTLANAKKWRFRPNRQREVILVYKFQLSEGFCKTEGGPLIFVPPNFATVTGCRVPVPFR